MWFGRAVGAARLLGWVKVRYSFRAVEPSENRPEVVRGMAQPDDPSLQIDWEERFLFKGRVDHLPFDFGRAREAVCRLEVPGEWGIDSVQNAPQWTPVDHGSEGWNRYVTLMTLPPQDTGRPSPKLVPLRVTTWVGNLGGWRDAWRVLGGRSGADDPAGNSFD